MISGVSIKAPAKINLHLEVAGKRRDGFHDIFSIFQAVSLYDYLNISVIAPELKISLEGNFDFPEKENLIYRAVVCFREYTGLKEGVLVTCKKIIPSGAGLGGGSSDAASTLIGLNELFKAGLSVKELMSIGAELGSDIPFFFNTPTALVTGRGENVVPLTTKWDLPVIIIDTGLHVNTAEAYCKIDKISKRRKKKIDLALMYNDPPEKWTFFNDFSMILEKENPVYREAVVLLKTTGAVFSMVSGSGSAVFGIFRNIRKAENAVELIKSKFKSVHIGKMLAIPPKAVYNSLNN